MTVVHVTGRIAAAYELVGVRVHVAVVGTLARSSVNEAACKEVLADALEVVLGRPLVVVGHAVAHGIVFHITRAGRLTHRCSYFIHVHLVDVCRFII